MLAESSYFDTPIEFLKGVGPFKGALLRKELSISNYGDLLNHFPYRHIDKTKVLPIGSIEQNLELVQVAGTLLDIEMIGSGKGRRLTAILKDQTGLMQLVWFQSVSQIQKTLKSGSQYLIFGKVGWYKKHATNTAPRNGFSASKPPSIASGI